MTTRDRPAFSFATLVQTDLALRVFERHMPHIFKFRHLPPAEADSYVEEWALALRSLPPSLLVSAAKSWIAETADIPKPSTFAGFVRHLDSSGKASAEPRPTTEREELAATRAELAALVHRELGSWRLVASVWDVLMKQAGADAEARAAVQEGRICPEALQRAVEEVRGARGHQAA